MLAINQSPVKQQQQRQQQQQQQQFIIQFPRRRVLTAEDGASKRPLVTDKLHRVISLLLSRSEESCKCVADIRKCLPPPPTGSVSFGWPNGKSMPVSVTYHRNQCKLDHSKEVPIALPLLFVRLLYSIYFLLYSFACLFVQAVIYLVLICAGYLERRSHRLNYSNSRHSNSLLNRKNILFAPAEKLISFFLWPIFSDFNRRLIVVMQWRKFSGNLIRFSMNLMIDVGWGSSRRLFLEILSDSKLWRLSHRFTF